VRIARRTLLLFGALVIVVIAAVIIVRRLHKADVWVVNGLEVTLDVEVGGTHVTVPSRGQAVVKARGKAFNVVARLPDGTVVDSARGERETRDTPFVFNILSAAPLSTPGVIYTFSGFTMDKPREGTQLWYRRTVEFPNIDFYFEAPTTIEKPSTPGPVQKMVLRANGIWLDTFHYLMEHHRLADARQLAEAVSVAQPDSADVASALEQVASGEEQTAAGAAAAKTRSDNKTTQEAQWTTWSLNKQMQLSQAPAADGACTLTCTTASGEAVWSSSQCIATSRDIRFLAGDCSRAVIIHREVDKGTHWREGNVVLVYEKGELVESHTAGEYVSLAPRDGDHFDWLPNGPHLRDDQHFIELATTDNQVHVIRLW